MCKLLLKIYSILECIVGCVTICNINCYVVIVTVGKVDVAAVISGCCVGTCRYFVVTVIVNFNPNVVVKSTLVPISIVTNTHPAASSKRI